nr:hypothetical protein [Candidatus Sigynarchaeota archaeon]
MDAIVKTRFDPGPAFIEHVTRVSLTRISVLLQYGQGKDRTSIPWQLHDLEKLQIIGNESATMKLVNEVRPSKYESVRTFTLIMIKDGASTMTKDGTFVMEHGVGTMFGAVEDVDSLEID